MLVAGLVVLALSGTQLWIVARHPEPAPDEPDAASKPRYASLVRPASVSGALALALLGAWAIITWLPVHLQPAWLVWGSAALVLVGVDAATTWLPARAALFAEGWLLLGIAAGALLAPQGPGMLLLAALLGAVGAGGLFWLIWRFSRSFGFGDVRLAAMMGALSAMSCAQCWYSSLLAGSIAAALWGLVTMAWRRRRPSPLGKAFAYGPGLWLGPWLAWGWLAAAG